MKPLNLDNKPCSPISSNCVVWQGPDIECIKLCKGDTVSDVVFALATELCTILETLKVSNYDLTCFNLQACNPKDFQALIQFLIEKICENQGITPESQTESGCPDCVVTVADCFVTGTQTTMQLLEYVTLIGNRICSIVNELTEIRDLITQLAERVDDLENQPLPSYPVLTVQSKCDIGSIGGGTDSPVQTILQEFFDAVWCDFYYDAVGTITALNNAALSQCVQDTDLSLYDGRQFQLLSGWTTGPNRTIAQSITNLWIVVCDTYQYLSNLNVDVSIKNEGVEITSAVSSIDFVGANIEATAVGNDVTVTLTDTYGLDTFSATVFINGLYQPEIFLLNTASQIPSLVSTPPAGFPNSPVVSYYNQVRFNDQVVTATATPGSFVSDAQAATIIPASFGTLVNNSGSGSFFTVAEAGLYYVNASVNLKSDNKGTLSWQTGSLQTVVTSVDFGTSSTTIENLPVDAEGTFGIGIIKFPEVIVGNSMPLIAGLNNTVDVSCGKVVYLNALDNIKLTLQNLTDRLYDGVTYTSDETDVITFSITKLT